MKTIWKYKLPIRDLARVPVEFGAKLIHVGLDPAGVPSIWCEVEPSGKQIVMPFFVLGTGHEIPEAADQHVGSFVDTAFVWHVYSVK